MKFDRSTVVWNQSRFVRCYLIIPKKIGMTFTIQVVGMKSQTIPLLPLSPNTVISTDVIGLRRLLILCFGCSVVSTNLNFNDISSW